MTTAMGYFEGLGGTAAAIQYDGTVYGAQRLQDWISDETFPPEYEQDEVHDVSTVLFIYGGSYAIDSTDWLVNTIEGDWFIFDDENMQDLFEYTETEAL